MPTAYEWFKKGKHYIMEKIITESKKPAIPQATGLRKRLIDATNQANEKRKSFINKIKGNHVR